jgi:DNA invertase Pin-like site-specific DNA recombinase
MATRGTPLPQALRDEAKKLREDDRSYRAIARELGIDHHTAKKYTQQVSPKR